MRGKNPKNKSGAPSEAPTAGPEPDAEDVSRGKKRGPKRGRSSREKTVYLGVRVKMTVRDMLQNIRVAQGWGPEQLQEAFKRKEERVKTRSGRKAVKSHCPTKSLEELAIIVEVLEEDLKSPITTCSTPPRLCEPPASPEYAPVLTGYSSDSSEDIIPSPQHYTSYSPQDCYQARSPDCYQAGSPDSYQARSPDCYQAGSPDCYQARSPDSYQARSPDSYQAGSPDSYQAGSPDSYQARSPDCYQAGSPDCYQARSPDSYQAGSPDSYQAVSPDCYQAGSPDCYQARSPDSYQAGSPDCYQARSPDSEPLSCPSPVLEELHSPRSWSLDSSAFFWTQLQREEMVLNDMCDAELLSTDEHGRNLLHKAVRVGKRALAYAIAKRMAAINSLDLKDSYGMTALHYAAKNNHHLTVCDLIRLGANANNRNHQGKSCLHLSAEQGYTQVLEVLKQLMMDGYFVDVEATDNSGMSVLQCAALALKATVSGENSGSTPSSRLHSLRKEQMLETLECVLQMGSHLHSVGCWGVPRSS